MFWKKSGKRPERDPTSLGNILLHAGICTNEQLQVALAEKRRRDDQFLGDILVQMGFLSREMLVKFLNQQAYLRRNDRRQVLHLVRTASRDTASLSGNLDSLSSLALQVVQKLK
jgi:hypothetical protein